MSIPHAGPACRAPGGQVTPPLCLLLFFFLEAALPLMLSLVSISSLLSQDSPDTERTSSVGTQEASKPHRDFTGMTNDSKYNSREEKAIQVQEMLQWNHCLKAFWWVTQASKSWAQGLPCQGKISRDEWIGNIITQLLVSKNEQWGWLPAQYADPTGLPEAIYNSK